MASVTDWLRQTDDLTVALGLSLAAVFLLGSYLAPQSLVHPILLGRQSDVERVRKPGESAVYRNYGTGLSGRLPMRPAKEVVSLNDLIKAEFTGERKLWNTGITNEDLKRRVEALGTGLVRNAGLVPEKSSVLLLLNDSLEFLITDLALAAHSIKSYTISSLTLLSAVLEQAHLPFEAIVLHSHSVEYVLEQLEESPYRRDLKFVIVGSEPVPNVAHQLSIHVVLWDELVKQGSQGESVQSNTPEPEDVFSVSYYSDSNSGLKATQLTHLNLTAGVTATRVLLPLNSAISPSDTILSAHSLSTPFGRAIAYTALYDGTHFATTDSTAIFEITHDEGTPAGKSDIHTCCKIPAPTILFLTDIQLRSVAYQILKIAKRSWLYSLSWRHKLSTLQQGFISKDTVWDRLTFEEPRKSVLGAMSSTLRGIISSGGPLDGRALAPTRIAFSVPFVNAHIHPLVAGPIFASHPLDLQTFHVPARGESDDPFAYIAHVGPATVNLEVKLLNVDDSAIEGGASPTGDVLVRGPSVTLPLDGEAKPHNWLKIGDRATVQTNGTFKVLSSALHEEKP